ncbi:LPS export ABC transporter permease LptF [Sneathiella glossodoripedis]|uniref:LPS export ABC transporter permease LptF n=1 Tax=Sneathiella glossodoripedis TaxID=418853 RepID=UPI00046E8161|nr:LPS export ABC transporter permease LptF [Sneathiella glossodoripedis]
MKKINWYIIVQLLGPTLFITFALTGVIWLSQTLQFVEKLITGLPISTFLTLTVLLLPGILKFTLMLGLFFGILFTFNKLYTESELIVMWSAGLSKAALMKPVMYLALFLTVLLYIFSFYVTPFGVRTLRELRVEWRESLASVVLREGVFNSISNNVTVYIREKTDSGKLLGILVHDERVREKPVTYMAQEGAFIKTDAGPRFYMKNGNLQEVRKDEAKLSILYFDDYTLDLSQFEKQRSGSYLRAEARYIHELLWPEEEEISEKNLAKIRSELHNRLVLPIYTIALALIALAGTMSGEFSRRGRAPKLFAAGGSGILLVVCALALFNLIEKNAAFVVPIYILPVLASLLAAHLASGGRISIPFRSRSILPPSQKPEQGGL